MRGYTSMYMSDFFCSCHCLPIVQVMNMGGGGKQQIKGFKISFDLLCE